MRLWPTRRLLGMLVAAGVIYLFATNSQVVWLYLVSSLVLGIAVIGVAAPAMVLRRLHPVLEGHTREGFVAPLAQDRGRLFAGDRLTLVLDLGSESPPVELGPVRVNGVTRAVQSEVRRSWGLAVLPAGPRGRLSLGAIRVSTSWPLGIARAERWVGVGRELVVNPLYVLPSRDVRQGSREPAGTSTRRGPGDDFIGIREYRSGDSQRRIHWPTSARAGSLMVVETAEEASSSTNYELRLEAGCSPEAAELAVSLVASLGAGNVAGGMPLAIAVPGQPRRLQRWAEALGALATAAPGAPVPALAGRDASRVSAAGDKVTWSRGARARGMDGGTSLDEALRAIGTSK